MERLRKLWRLPGAERCLLARAALLLAGVRFVLWLLPFRVVRALLEPAPMARGRGRHSRERVAWAVGVASRYVPRATCLVQALAAQRLLAQEGYAAELRVGVSTGVGFRAHAWVESEGVVVGWCEGEQFTPLLKVAAKAS
ncbi:MAG: lasso peptide biosynthesis B2 protein [Acidobacteriota bacterium]